MKNLMRLAAFIITTLPCYAQQLNIDMNDISVLFPLPEAGEESLPAFRDLGLGGPFLPRAAYDEIVSRVPLLQRFKYEDYRIVSLRLDPCFDFRSGCEKQIRAVAQPVKREINGTLTTEDTAFHMFFKISDEAYVGALSDISRANTFHFDYLLPSVTESLNVNPRLKALGLNSEYGFQLVKSYLSRAGRANLFRLAFMNSNEEGTFWQFGGFNITPTTISPIQLPRVDEPLQTFSLRETPGGTEGIIAPVPVQARAMQDVLHPTHFLPPEIRSQAFTSSVAVENPDIHTPTSVDCVTCHVAGVVKMRADGLDFPSSRKLFKSDLSLDVNSSTYGNPKVLRAFGYFEKEPSFNQRVVNETAKALEAIKRDFP